MKVIKEIMETYMVNQAECSLLLGVSEGSLSDWISDNRVLPDYVKNSIDSHMRHSASTRSAIRRERIGKSITALKRLTK